MLENIITNLVGKDSQSRKSKQPELPKKISDEENIKFDYTPYPYHSLGDKKIYRGYDTLIEWVKSHKLILIDGYSGVFWEEVIECFDFRLKLEGISINWIRTSNYLKSEELIDEMLRGFLGQEDSIWGTKCTIPLPEFFNFPDFPDNDELTIVIGVGAGLLQRHAPLIYLDVPKNEIQYRMRAQVISNLGKDFPEKPAQMYKRFYFVDWVILTEHKKNLLDRITIFADTQWINDLSWIYFDDLKKGLQDMGKTAFRARPWFEAGAWGGQWMKHNLKGLNQNEVNYAWSFELITPENGLVFESEGNLLETAFDLLMLISYKEVLGKHADTFKLEFPIRFDFLDTFNGGNLSIQCHPSTSYIRKNFGETITQDETYYILDCKDDAYVYLGFQDDIEPAVFKKSLEESLISNTPIDVTKFIQVHESKKHDLFLIPNQTIHSAGEGNLVLEISATPYIFTFKMYDWLRLDLNGEPRPINIEHAFKNLNFERKGQRVKSELLSTPVSINKGDDWHIIHYPTHPEHFYDVHRIDFQSSVSIEKENICQVMMLVEGETIAIEIDNRNVTYYQLAETFIIPASVKKYKLINKGKKAAKVIKAFLK